MVEKTPTPVEHKKEGRRRQVNWTKVLGVLLGILLLVFVVGPGLIGYSVYRQIGDSNYTVEELGQNVRGLNLELEKAQANVSVYSTFVESLQAEARQCRDDLTACKTERATLRADLNFSKNLCEQRVALLKEELTHKDELYAQANLAKETAKEEAADECSVAFESLESQYAILEGKYDAFVENMARSVCCKQRFDDPSISAYEVSQNKLKCVAQGEFPLNCTFS